MISARVCDVFPGMLIIPSLLLFDERVLSRIDYERRQRTLLVLHCKARFNVKKSPCPFEQSPRVTLSAAKSLSRAAARSFAALRMTGLGATNQLERLYKMPGYGLPANPDN